MSTANSGRELPDASAGQLLDPLTSVRKHPEWYFRGGEFDAHEATSLLAAEALRAGATDVTIRIRNNWIVFSADTDWLDGDLAPFLSPQVDAAAGINSSRCEVALVAFCDTVITKTPGDRSRSWSVPSRAEDIEEHWLDGPGRVIAFLPPAEPRIAIDEQDRNEAARKSRLRLLPGGEEQITTAVDSFIKKRESMDT